MRFNQILRFMCLKPQYHYWTASPLDGLAGCSLKTFFQTPLRVSLKNLYTFSPHSKAFLPYLFIFLVSSAPETIKRLLLTLGWSSGPRGPGSVFLRDSPQRLRSDCTDSLAGSWRFELGLSVSGNFTGITDNKSLSRPVRCFYTPKAILIPAVFPLRAKLPSSTLIPEVFPSLGCGFRFHKTIPLLLFFKASTGSTPKSP